MKYLERGSLTAMVTAICLLAEVGRYPKVLHYVMRMMNPASHEIVSVTGRGIWDSIAALACRSQRSATLFWQTSGQHATEQA